jgi:hypothetical protein
VADACTGGRVVVAVSAGLGLDLRGARVPAPRPPSNWKPKTARPSSARGEATEGLDAGGSLTALDPRYDRRRRADPLGVFLLRQLELGTPHVHQPAICS